MNLLVTLDSNYVHQLMVMLKSIETTNPDTALTVYIIHTRLTEFDISRLKYNFESIEFIEIIPDDSIFEGAHFTKRISKETYYRLLLCEYLPQSVDRILYLDPDTVVLKNLSEFYNYDFGSKCFVGAGHTTSLIEEFNRIRLGMCKKSHYINAGVMMINVKEFRKIFSIEAVSDLISKKGKLLFQADQDVINALYYRKIHYVEAYKYNLDEHTYRRLKLNHSDIIKDTVIIHYDGKNKPWKASYSGSMKEYYDYFEKLLYQTDREIPLPIAN